MTKSSCPVATLRWALEGDTVSRPYCRMGQDYPCECVYCNDYSYRKALDACAIANAASADYRATLVRASQAFQLLAEIGKAIAAALSPGLGVALMIRDAGALRSSGGGNLRGFTFRVTGKRGAAKVHFGKVGLCKWQGINDYGGVKLGLQIEGHEKLAYVSLGQLDRIPMTIEQLDSERVAKTEATIVRDAIAPHRPKLVVALKRRGKGPIAYVVSGRDAGQHGVVFWVGPDKRTQEPNARLGIRTASGAVVWASAYECASEPMVAVTREERTELERVAADAALDGYPERAREILAQTRKPQ